MRATWPIVMSLPTLLAADWPQWLGPGRNAVSTETAVVSAWQARGPRELWRRAPGAGYASFAVVAGTAYTLASDGKDERLLAIDGVSGAERWSTRVDAAWIDGMGYHGPRATPTVAGDRVVALSGRGTVGAWSVADGRMLWTVDLVAALDGDRPQWGYSGSPLVSGGRVYLTGGGAGRGSVALNLSDGRVVWNAGDWTAGYSSPVRATLGGADQVVFFTGKGAVGLTADSGEQLWSFPWQTNYDMNAATPLILPGDRLFIASGYGTGAAMLQVSGRQVKEVWRSKSMKNKMATSVFVAGHLYGFNEEYFTAVDARTGATVWSESGLGRGSLIGVGEHLIVLSETCSLQLVAANPKGFTPLGEAVQVLPKKPCWTAPALADGVLYVRDTEQMAAFDLR